MEKSITIYTYPSRVFKYSTNTILEYVFIKDRAYLGRWIQNDDSGNYNRMVSYDLSSVLENIKCTNTSIFLGKEKDIKRV